MVNASQSSAAGLISLLSDTDPEIITYAIEQLNLVVPLLWAETSEVVGDIESLTESSHLVSLPTETRLLASLLTSKIYFYLGALDEAVDQALNAGEVFGSDPALKEEQGEGGELGEYRETIIAQALDRAISHSSATTPQDSRLTAIVLGVLDSGKLSSSAASGRLTIGLTLSLQRLDLLEQIYSASTSENGQGKDESLLTYVLNEVVGGESGNESWGEGFRDQLLHLLLKLFLASQNPSYSSITHIYLLLNDPSLASNALKEMIKTGKLLEAYQMAFDLVEGGRQAFLESVEKGLEGEADAESDEIKNLKEILSGEKSIRLYLEFLQKNNKADLGIVKNTKEALESRHSIFHSAVSFLNAFSNAGTTSDTFLRENLDWLGQSSDWSRFTTTAALGVIHKGSLARAMTVLGPYLPDPNGGPPGPGATVYSEGGALYALGLINAKHGKKVTGYLKQRLQEGTDEVVQHGAALGLGVAGLASHDEDVYEDLRNVLFQDSSVAGEAAGYAMGLTLLGSGSEKAVEEMLQYAHETQHEKIIRGLALGVAFLFYGKGEAADSVVDRLIAEKDSILRYGGMYTIALAYAGTANNKAIRRLLHVAVSDVNDDVRRAAVTALGFVMFRNHTQVPSLVQLLSQSYNPHVRHGATLALGIACAGTGSLEACELLEPLTKDHVDFVRQGAFIALAMILIQHTDAQSPKVEKTRKLYEKVIADKHEDSLAKFGATIAQGIIDAGGRNVTISLQSKAGTPDMTSIVGMTMFCQFWYWYPMAHGLSLSFSPTAIIGLDVDLKAPKFDIVSNIKPSVFAYPEAWKAPVKEKVEKVTTAVLSTTARAQARAKAKEREKADTDGDAAMDTVSDDDDDDDGLDDKPEVAKTDEKEGEAEKKRAAEPSSQTLSNMTRATPAQLHYISFPSEGRYIPVRPVSRASLATSDVKKGKKPATLHELTKKSAEGLSGGGIILLRDTKPDEEKEYLELNQALDAPPPPPPAAASDVEVPSAAVAAMEIDDGPEASAPAPFEYPFGSDGA